MIKSFFFVFVVLWAVVHKIVLIWL